MLLLVYKCGHMAANCEIGLTCKCGNSSYPTINLIYIKTGKKGNLLVDTWYKIPQVYHVHRRTITMKDKRPSCEKKDDPMVMSVLLQFKKINGNLYSRFPRILSLSFFKLWFRNGK